MQKKEEKIREYLKRLNMAEVFACLDEKDMAGLSIVNYKKGEYLFHAGDKVEAIFFLAKGKCRVSNSTSEGKEIAIDFDIPSGRLIGEMELASGIDFFHSVSAAVDSDVLRIPLEVAEKKLMKDAEFLRYVCRQLAWELTESGKERVRVSLYDARESRKVSIWMGGADGGKKIYYFLPSGSIGMCHIRAAFKQDISQHGRRGNYRKVQK